MIMTMILDYARNIFPQKSNDLAPHRLCQRARTTGTVRMIDFSMSDDYYASDYSE